MKESITFLENTGFLNEKAKVLSQPATYGDTDRVEVIETHMSMVFLTDRFVYKLKKPVTFDFLDFSTLEARHKYCMEEVNINQTLAQGIYLEVLPLTRDAGQIRLDGAGEIVDWLVKMRRLPAEQMLQAAIREGTVRREWVHKAAEKLVDFYLASAPLLLDQKKFRKGLMNDIESNCGELLHKKFKLNHEWIVSITADLLHFIIKHADLFDRRMAEGRVIDAHGDLRPEHICLGSEPLIIDRLEFNRDLRIMDVAEELSFLGLECEMLESADIGQVFLDVYKLKSADVIPDVLINFYKAKRAFLRAKLSISHLLEEKYLADAEKWRGKCNAYLLAAVDYCRKT